MRKKYLFLLCMAWLSSGTLSCSGTRTSGDAEAGDDFRTELDGDDLADEGSSGELDAPDGSDEFQGDIRDGDDAEEIPVRPNQFSYLYIWGNMPDLLDDTPYSREMLWKICSERGITDLLCATTDRYPMANEAQWRSFIAEANARGITVWGELGGTYLDIAADYHSHQVIVQEILEFNSGGTATFAGLALDIEGGNMTERYQWLLDTYLPDLKSWSFDGETLASQGLELYFYDDGLILDGYLTESLWESVASEFDVIELQSYGPSSQDIIDKADGGPGYGLSRADKCEAMGKDFSVVIEIVRYPDGTTYDSITGWMDQDDLEQVFDDVHAHFESTPGYRGLCIHALQGLSLRHLLRDSQLSGTMLTLELMFLSYGGYTEELLIESPGVDPYTFTPALNTLESIDLPGYTEGQHVTITATRVSGDHGPTIVMDF